MLEEVVNTNLELLARLQAQTSGVTCAAGHALFALPCQVQAVGLRAFQLGRTPPSMAGTESEQLKPPSSTIGSFLFLLDGAAFRAAASNLPFSSLVFISVSHGCGTEIIQALKRAAVTERFVQQGPFLTARARSSPVPGASRFFAWDRSVPGGVAPHLHGSGLLMVLSFLDIYARYPLCISLVSSRANANESRLRAVWVVIFVAGFESATT